MKIIPKIAFALVALGLALSMPSAHAAQDSQATLKSEAKITEAEAQATA